MNPVVSTQTGYEFTPDQNAIIKKLAGRLRLAGFLQAAVGVLMAGGFTSRTVVLSTSSPALALGVDLPIVGATIVAGVLMVLAAPPFFAIVQTVGKDIEHVMSACDKLSKLMGLLMIALALATAVWMVVFLWLVAIGTPFINTPSAS